MRASAVAADEAARERAYRARDTLSDLSDGKPDAQVCLQQLAWKPAEFEVTCAATPDAAYDYLVRFPSPVSTGDANNDSVSMEWYVTRDADSGVRRAPAVLVVHESGSQMPVGRLFARGVQAAGFHALMIHLPHYGARRTGDREPEAKVLFQLLRQAIADVRRARDAVAVLPHIDPDHIALQGTSLGGFVVATSASLDRGFQSVHIMLAGGNLYEMLMNGRRETAEARQRLAEQGVTGDKLKDLLWQIEPTRIAHRLDPQQTWLYSADEDPVVPIANALALARSAGLDASHHIRVSANHHTAIIYFPVILQQMSDQLRTHVQTAN